MRWGALGRGGGGMGTGAMVRLGAVGHVALQNKDRNLIANTGPGYCEVQCGQMTIN